VAIIYSIGGIVKRFLQLPDVIHKSVTESRNRRIAECTQNDEANQAVEELRHYTDCYIRFKYPEASEVLRSSLVDANAMRWRRLYYEMTYRKRISPVKLFPIVSTPIPDNRTPKDVKAPSVTRGVIKALYDSIFRVPQAESVVVNSGLSFPAIPESNECPYCGGILNYYYHGRNRTVLWNDHIMKDLEPYICLFDHYT